MRRIEDLEANAIKFWSGKIAETERNASIIPRLIQTQDKFIAILKLADKGPGYWINALDLSNAIPANLFLKHLMVLSDMGGEMLQRLKGTILKAAPDGKMPFLWNDDKHEYIFQTLSNKSDWNNKNLKVDGKGLEKSEELTPLIMDVVNLLLFGGLSTLPDLPENIEQKCMIGSFIGKDNELNAFVTQRYIWVSKITGGATSNSLGQLAQKYVLDYLKERLPDGWNLEKQTISDVSQNERTSLAFDIVVVSPKKRICTIEISFQVTTNSVIERKAGQAQSRQRIFINNMRC